MAIVSKFKRGSTELSLNSASSGFSLAGDGWLPAVASPVYMGDPEPVVETLHLLLKRSSHDNLATSMQALHQMQVWAEQYMNARVEEDPVWLHAKMDNETGERRALVRKIEIQYGASWYGDEGTALDIPLTIAVTRGPYWESTSARNFPDDTPTAASAVKYDYTAVGTGVSAHDIVGDVPARIEDFRLTPDTGAGLGTVWMGIRSAQLRTSDQLTNFDPIWELEDGTNDAADATDTVDATASGGNCVVVSESALDWDDTWHRVLYILLGNVDNTNAEDHVGLFLWLLRTLVTSGTWEVQLKYGFSSQEDDNLVEGAIVEVSNTNWFYKEMDVIPMPLADPEITTYGSGAADNFAVHLYARRTSGAGDLYVDCFNLIPADEGFLKFSTGTFGDTSEVELGQAAGNAWDSVKRTISSDQITEINLIEDVNNFALPPGDGYMVIVYQDETLSDITETLTLSPTPADTSYYERWLSLRGSE